MSKLYEVVDKLKKFTNELKEDEELILIKSFEPIIESISLCYEEKNETITIPISEVRFFNAVPVDDKLYGYLFLRLDNIDIGKLDYDYLYTENHIMVIIVNYDDKSNDSIGIEWSTVFNFNIEDNVYDTIFCGKKISLGDVLKD